MSSGRSPAASELDRLEAILDAYGGEPARWPDAERDAMLALLARSADARRRHHAALRLDSALDSVAVAAPSPGLEDRIVAAATSSAAQPRLPATVRALGSARAERRVATRRPLRVLAGALPIAAAAALALWLYGERAPRPEVATAPLLEEIQIATLGVYETPGDALLAGVVLDDVYDSDAWTGCSDGDLGCMDVETLPLEPLSRDQDTIQEVRFLS